MKIKKPRHFRQSAAKIFDSIDGCFWEGSRWMGVPRTLGCELGKWGLMGLEEVGEGIG